MATNAAVDVGPGQSPRSAHVRNAMVWVFGALGGILWGYDTGVISGALLFIKRDIPLSPLTQGMVVSGLLVGCMLGAGVAGRLSDRWGRRRLILVAAAVFVVGTLAATVAGSAAELIAGRFVIGIGVGVVSAVVPLYLTELAPAHMRGRLTSLMQILVTTGILVAYLVDYGLSDAGAWRWMLGLGAVPAVLLGAGIAFQPESPRWLVKHGRVDAARAVLRRLRPDAQTAENELDEIQRTNRAEADQRQGRLRELVAPSLRRSTLLGVVMVFFQNWMGINTIIYYAPTLLTSIGFGAAGAIVANVGVGLVNLLMTLPALWFIDRSGRRPLLTLGSIGMMIGMLGLAAAQLADGRSGTLLMIATLLSLAVYVGTYAMSWGPVQWVVLPELFPLRARGTAVGVCIIFNWLFNMLLSLIFPTLLSTFGPTAMFVFFAGTSALGLWFTRRALPETKGRSLESLHGGEQAPATAS